MKCLTCQGACCESFSLPFHAAQLQAGDPVSQDINVFIALHAEAGTDLVEAIANHEESADLDDRLEFSCACKALTEEGACAIYDNRPMVCRTYQAGGPDCLATVKERRTREQYEAIRDEDDPEVEALYG